MFSLSRKILGTIICSIAIACMLIIPAVGWGFEDGIPNQTQADMAAATPGSSGQAGWGDMAGGVSARPYIQSLSVINGAQTTALITNGTTTAPALTQGSVSAVVSPYNLCKASETVGTNGCLASPNRVGISLIYGAGNGASGWDFGAPSTPVSPTINADTVIDMTIKLNTLGQNLRWSWLSGKLLYWSPSDLGTADAAVHLRFNPARTPYVASFPAGSGCTATPITNCSVAQANGEGLAASLVLSLDSTLDQALTGAVFATQDTIFGYLVPQVVGGSPSVDIQMASTHTRSDGSAQLGSLSAFIPSAALLGYYGVLPSDASGALSTTRNGSAGTNGPVSTTTWTQAVNGADGALISVGDITFSTPEYKVERSVAKAKASASQRGRRSASFLMSARVKNCAAKNRCKVFVYKIGSKKTHKSAIKVMSVAARRSFVIRKRAKTGRVLMKISKRKLRKGDKYLVAVRSKKGKLLASTTGTVR